MRCSTFFTLLMATSSPLAVLSGPLINYGGISPSTSVDSATLTKSTPVSGNRKNIAAAPNDGVKGTATDTSLGPAMTGLDTSGSQKQYAPPGKGGSSILLGSDALPTGGPGSVDHQYSPGSKNTPDTTSETTDECLSELEDLMMQRNLGKGTSSGSSALDSPPSDTYGKQHQVVPPAGGVKSVTTDTMMPTDTMVSSTSTSSPLPANGKRQAKPIVSPVTIPSTLSTSTIAAFPPGGSDKQKQQIQPGGSTPTDTARPLGTSDHMVNIAVAGSSKTLSAIVAESTGTDGTRELVIKKVSCAGKLGKDGSQKQRVKPSPQDGSIPDTATRRFDLGAPTAVSDSGGKKNAVMPPLVGATSTDSMAAAPTSLA